MTRLVISASQLQSQLADLLPVNKYRKSQLTYELIQTYGLLELFDEVLEEPIASREDIEQFHDSRYLDLILDDDLNRLKDSDADTYCWDELADLVVNNVDIVIRSTRELMMKYQDLCSEYNNDDLLVRKRKASDVLEGNENDNKPDPKTYEAMGLNGDCPLFNYLPIHCYATVGSTLSLINHISDSERSICINWDGGRHHAMRTRASGFCYVNDIVLLIMQLRKKSSDKITYIDFDLHHGDGVEKAFQYSKNVQTISIHLYEPGFFPCTGSIEDSKLGKNIINIPVEHGLDDESLTAITKYVVVPKTKEHDPTVIVIQCGGDGLLGDKYKEWQLSIRGLTANILYIIEAFPQSSIVLLGGGGYNHLLMSRFHTYLTWMVIKKYKDVETTIINEDEDTLIPDHPYIELYAPEHYKFWYYDQHGGQLKNNNKIQQLLERII